MKNKKFISSVLIGIGAVTFSSSKAFADKNGKMEKCYGIVKAGKNDCHDLKGTHSCASEAKISGDKNEWILLPKGVCERIVGGVLKK